MQAATDAVAKGERDTGAVVRVVREVLDSEPILKTDYVALVDAATLEPVEQMAPEMLLAVAVHANATRLIDNMALGN